ncbi:MAG TPA: hypothetical protein VNM37_12355, partial [Candidatus Dormibacteraeota bacterium]|nr:hypothetical protein [Candidatus Dormibacteraeota bacterium]
PGRLTYPKGASWKTEETMVMASMGQPGADASAAMPPASSAVMAYAVEKVFPDGAALVSQTPVSCKKGASLKDLKDAPLPNGGKPGYSLYTRDGRMFMVQGAMKAGSPAEEAVMQENGNVDEVELLKASATTAQYFKVMRNQSPLDQYRIPAKRLAPGGQARVDTYAVTRLPDATVNGVVCEVYRGVMDPLVETDWLDAKAGRIVKRTVVQGDPAQMEITQTVIQ